MNSVTAKAWEATKEKEDPSFDAIPNGQFKSELEARVDGVRRTGIAVNPFEEKVKELLDKEKDGEDEKALGTNAELPQSAPPPAAPVVEVVEKTKSAPKVEAKSSAKSDKK